MLSTEPVAIDFVLWLSLLLFPSMLQFFGGQHVLALTHELTSDAETVLHAAAKYWPLRPLASTGAVPSCSPHATNKKRRGGFGTRLVPEADRMVLAWVACCVCVGRGQREDVCMLLEKGFLCSRVDGRRSLDIFLSESLLLARVWGSKHCQHYGDLVLHADPRKRQVLFAGLDPG